VNTEEELGAIVGKPAIGVGAIIDHKCLMVFFEGATLAVKFGVMTWGVFEDTVH
jgi:hypothetical protein